MADQVTVGIDIGTSSVKAIAADPSGRVVARCRIAHPILTPTAGALEHDVDRAWRRGVADTFDAVSRGLDVAAVNVSAMVPSLAAVDAAGRALTPGLLYGDERGLDPTGPSVATPAESGEVVRFLTWCSARAPEAAGFWPAQAVANHQLCGVGAIDTVTAMTTVPLFDYTAWDPVVAAGAGARTDQLPRLAPGAETIGHTSDGVAVGGGTIDAFAEQLVSGASRVGDVLVILGSTLIVWIVTDEWIDRPGLWTVPHTTPGLTLIGGASNASGLFGSVVDRIVAPGHEGLADPSDVPVWLPYVRGERVPLHDPHRRGSLHGITMTQGPSAVRRAAFEASGFVVRQMIDVAGVVATRIVASGGGTQSVAWLQALADASGLPVDSAAVPENAALGAAWLARGVAGLDQTDGPESWVRFAAHVEPDQRWARSASDRYATFRELSGV